MLRERIDEIQAQTESEKEWWEKRRDLIRQDFEKELAEEAGTKTEARVVSDDDGVLVDPSTPGTPSGSKKKKGRK
jgi:translocation protein SEC66